MNSGIPKEIGSAPVQIGAALRLRTVLFQIVSYAEFLLEDSPGPLTEHGRNLLHDFLHRSTTLVSSLELRGTRRGSSEHVREATDQAEEALDICIYQMNESLELFGSNTEIARHKDIIKIKELWGCLLEMLATWRSNSEASESVPEVPVASRSLNTSLKGSILVVDDNEANRDVLSRRLLRDGCDVMLAGNGRQALRMIDRYRFDVVLLDIMMPEMDGLTALTRIRENQATLRLPVIMISAVDELDTVVRCLQLGADDYLTKPFNPVILRARLGALLERKRLQDEEVLSRRELELALDDVAAQTKRTEALLLNILPSSVARELQESGEVQPMYFEDVTIAFADFVGFTVSSEDIPADSLVSILHSYFTEFDRITQRYGLEKLKTIGDCYMFAGGLPTRNSPHPVDVVLASMEMIHFVEQSAAQGPVDWKIRIGVHSGPVVAGVVGIHKFAFDVWGETVNLSSRMESNGVPNRINLSPSTHARVKDFFTCSKRENVVTKDGREMDMFLVSGLSSGLQGPAPSTPLETFRSRYQKYFRRDLPCFPDYLFS